MGRIPDAERALEQHARYGARWPRIDDPVLAAVTTERDDPRAVLERGVAMSEAGDVEGAIAAHESALRQDPSLDQAHANLITCTVAWATGRKPRSTIMRALRWVSISPTPTTTTV